MHLKSTFRAALPAAFFALTLAGCQQGSSTDPELKEYLRKMSESSAASATAGGTDAAASGKLAEEVRELKTYLREQLATTKTDLRGDIDEVVTRLKRLEGSIEGNGRDSLEAKSEVAKLRAEFSQLNLSATDQAANLNAIKTKLASINPEEFITMSKQLFEKESEAQKARRELADAIAREEAVNRRLDELQTANDRLTAEIQGLSGSDISNHPALRKMKDDLDQAKRDKRQADKDYANMKALADKQAQDIRTLQDAVAKGGGVPASLSGAAKPDDAIPLPDFSATVTSASIIEQTQQWIILAKLTKGTLPKVGDQLRIVNERNEFVCFTKVLQLYEADRSFGGETSGASVNNPPTSGDLVVLNPRETEAQGK